MKFEEALAAMRQGKRVRRREWADTVNIRVHGGSFLWQNDQSATLNLQHVIADDWELVPPPATKLYPFSVALEMARVDERVTIRRNIENAQRFYVAAGELRHRGGRDGGRLALLGGEALCGRDWVIEVVNG